jgi:hypothetical protein
MARIEWNWDFGDATTASLPQTLIMLGITSGFGSIVGAAFDVYTGATDGWWIGALPGIPITLFASGIVTVEPDEYK